MGGIGYVKMECSECGKEYDAMVLDGHISHLKMCDHCLRAILQKWFDERKKEFIESAPDRLIAGEGRREE